MQRDGRKFGGETNFGRCRVARHSQPVAFIRSVRGVTTSETLILCYHRVAEGVEDPFGLCVSPDNFAAHLDELVRRREPSTLDDLLIPSRRTRVVVTFDDGYSDNLSNAHPNAASKAVPITVFVTSGLLSGHAGFWWDRLAVLLRSRPAAMREFCLTAGGRTIRVPLDGTDFGADLSTVRRHLLPLSVPEIESALDAVSESWSVGSTPPPDARAMTPAELLELAAADCVTIGAHTVDHVRLSGRPEREQIDTVTASRRDLENFLGRPVSQFAYPFGRQDDFDDCSVGAVRAAKFDNACTTLPGTARPSTDPYRLPRRLVMNWGRRRFQAQLQRWRLG
jgi:peptidoglycan/xylan/chitin deacetylase (PgdA/CDA1 family)